MCSQCPALATTYQAVAHSILDSRMSLLACQSSLNTPPYRHVMHTKSHIIVYQFQQSVTGAVKL